MPAVRFYPIVTLVGDRDLASLTNALQLLENVLDGRLDGLNIADGVITTSKLADASVTFAKGSGLAQVVFGRYVGDGTQNRIINPGFDPKYVKVIKQTDSSLYESLNDGTNIITWKTDNTGIANGGGTDWQGLTPGGFKLGSAVGGGLSNANAVAYSYLAFR